MDLSLLVSSQGCSSMSYHVVSAVCSKTSLFVDQGCVLTWTIPCTPKKGNKKKKKKKCASSVFWQTKPLN